MIDTLQRISRTVFGANRSPAGQSKKLSTGKPIVMALLCGLVLTAADTPASPLEGKDVPDAKAGTSGLPVPRYVSLGAQEVNMRTGPGTRYPVKWIYNRKTYPVKVEAEFDIWRKIRDRDGEHGWVHGSLLSGRRTVIIAGDPALHMQTLYDKPHPASQAVLRAEDGVIADLLECQPDWCRVRIDGKKGWVIRDGLWGLLDTDGTS